MKRVLTSAGLLALGAAGLHAAYAPGLSSTETTKPWSISATLRGFYDDNYTTAPHGSQQYSWGYSVSPHVGLNITRDQTYIGLSYTYGMMYYAERPDNKYDQSHLFTGVLNHAFSERYSVDVSETFVVSQEPDVVDPTLANPYRSDQDNIANRAAINFNAQLTTVLSLLLGYGNTYVDYDQSRGDVEPPGSTASLSALLDRIDQLAKIELHWLVRPTTTAILGYQFGQVYHTSDELLLPNTANADIRDSRSHYVYVGAQHVFRPDLIGTVRVGGQFTDYYNDPENQDQVTPYLESNLSYNYSKGSYFRFGARHTLNQTDVDAFKTSNTDKVTLDQESSTLFAEISHLITPDLTGSLSGQFQNSVFNGGQYDGDADDFYLVGLNLTYRFNQFLSAETGWNYDRLSSDINDRSYSRNRVYVGITASY
jgi:hypothetical protein